MSWSLPDGLFWACLSGMLLGCSEGVSPGEAMAGHYTLEVVQFFSGPPQPVPAVDVSLGDTTVVERGDLTLSGEDRCTLELVYRWRYGGVPGGDTVSDTLSYAFHSRAPFPPYGQVDYFLLLRGPVHIAFLHRRHLWGGAADTGMGSNAAPRGRVERLSRSLPEGPCPWRLRGGVGTNVPPQSTRPRPRVTAT